MRSYVCGECGKEYLTSYRMLHAIEEDAALFAHLYIYHPDVVRQIGWYPFTDGQPNQNETKGV